MALLCTQAVSAFNFPGSNIGSIPDGPGDCGNLGTPLAVTFDVANVDTINRIELTMNVFHTFVGDLTVELEAPDLTRHLLFGKTGAFEGECGGDSSNLTGYYTFSDDAFDFIFYNWWFVAASLDTDQALPGAIYRTTSMGTEPDAGLLTSMNEAFSGVTDINGTWTLYFYDDSMTDVGNVSDAILTINPVGGQISDGEASYTINSLGSGTALETDIDYLESVFGSIDWLYRLSSDTREHQFPMPDYAIYHDDTVTITWLDVDGKGFRADLTQVIDQTGLETDEAILTSTMKITNLNANGININLFSYANFDVNGPDNDVGQLVNLDVGYIRQSDAPYQVEYRAGGNQNFQIGNEDLTDLLYDFDVDNLANLGNGFGPGDARTAFQWFSVPLSAGFIYQVQTTVAVGGLTAPEPLDPVILSDLIFADGFNP